MSDIVIILIAVAIFILVAPIVLLVLRSGDRDDINRLQMEVAGLKKALLTGTQPAPAAEQKQEAPQPEPVESMPAAIYVPAEPEPAKPVLPQEPKEPSYFETLTAGKIFSWIGGFMLFLGVIFAVKYSVENNLISPEARIMFGIFFALALIAASFIIKEDKYKTTADTFCGAGLAVLYGVIFSAKYFYGFLPATWAFMFMGVVSLASFWLAVYRKAQYIGFLGVITGFLTPLILNTGSQNYLVLFAYLAFINAGAIAAALKERWDNLLMTALGFTFMFQLIWFFPQFSESKIADFCIIFASYTAAAAAMAFKFKDSLSNVAKKAFGAYILGSFFFIFLSNMALPLIILAFFINLLLAALFYAQPQVYGLHFRVINIAAFLLLAAWLCSSNGKAQNGIILLMASLIFTALNTLAGMAKKAGDDNFSAALPAAALLLLFFMPGMSLWVLYTFGFIFVSLAVLSAFRVANMSAAYFAFIVYGAFLLRGVFSFHGFGLFELFAGLIYTSAFLCLSAFGLSATGKEQPANTEGLGICASVMPYVFLTAFILQNPSMELLGLAFCAGITAIILTVSYFNKNKYGLLCAAAGAFLPQVVSGGGAFGLNHHTMLFILLWVLIFAGPFLLRGRDDGDSSYNWAASVLAALTLFLTAYSAQDYASLSFATALITLAYGAAAFLLNKKEPGAYKAVFGLTAAAWLALFIFINVQIAHYYAAPDANTLDFEAHGNFAKTIAYTLAWGIYGMFTLFACLGTRAKYGVQAGIALVGIAVLKLLISDVWQISTLYRVIVFIAMAVILMAGSFLYQSLSARQQR